MYFFLRSGNFRITGNLINFVPFVIFMLLFFSFWKIKEKFILANFEVAKIES